MWKWVVLNFILAGVTTSEDADKGLNVRWKLDAPGLYDVAGTTLIYQRKFQKDSTNETVFILGPTNTTLNISVSSPIS